MKVLHIISGGEVGGSKRHLLSLAANAKSFKNIIICLMDGVLYREGLEMGLDIRLIEQRGRFDLSILDEIKKVAVKEDVDIINCHGGRANFLGMFLKKLINKPFVTTIHSDYLRDYEGNPFKTLIFSRINAYALKNFDYYIAVSKDFKNMLIDRGYNEEKIFVVYNGIDFDEVYSFDRDEIIEKYSLPRNKKFVTMVARLHPIKGHQFFFQAAKNVLKECPDVIFLIVGDGPIRSQLEEYVKEIDIDDSVVFLGFQRPDEFIYLSNFTSLTSRSESFPLSILESAKYKRTVVSTMVGGVSDLIEDGKNGYLVEYGDVEDLTEKMLNLLQDDLKCIEFGIKLHDKARALYSIERFVEGYEKIYEKIMEE
ncbi:glycosyltransferase family 4 protein [Caloramator sp. CAR-1]|uniref:glycosyltransferase family 4 protein n=1 Tax=Caloramator sp. CAR-1 TaxID=3062777 RepID=UPI0026E2409F|nr:glycosyltransferase family 4 protein [Caloramator sp. CAR-1]MDO6355575.1 glycosyltransferase family 4 protein [Caloramator sp. CAR-1]